MRLDFEDNEEKCLAKPLFELRQTYGTVAGEEYLSKAMFRFDPVYSDFSPSSCEGLKTESNIDEAGL